MKGYKAFNEDLKCCYNMQYEIGKEYTIDGKPILCKQGFHFCKTIADCYEYYAKNERTRICKIEAMGDIVNDGTKYCTNHIKILSEVKNPRAKSNKSNTCTGYNNTGLYNSGNNNSGNCNTGHHNIGDFNSSDSNEGDHNSGRCNTGDSNTGNNNSGNYNTGHHNSGDWNCGAYNTGSCNTNDYNSGHYNSGYYNDGDFNTGNHNKGNYNVGDWNCGAYNTGIFNTTGDFRSKIKIFDKESNWSYNDWLMSEAYMIMIDCPSIEQDFIEDKDKKEKTVCYRTADDNDRQKWWDNLPEMHKQIIYDIPNFDEDKFYQCTGIKVNRKSPNKRKNCKLKGCKRDG